jgi:hypothetical protein
VEDDIPLRELAALGPGKQGCQIGKEISVYEQHISFGRNGDGRW